MSAAPLMAGSIAVVTWPSLSLPTTFRAMRPSGSITKVSGCPVSS